MRKSFIFILCAFVILLCSCACAEKAGGSSVLVALGDSYTSGEGIEPFYGQNAPFSEKLKNPDWLAHRSEKSWPGMLRLPGVEGILADHPGENFFFAAASGAETKHLFLLTDEEKEAGQTAEFEKPYSREGISGVAVLPPQLSVFDELDEKVNTIFEGTQAEWNVLTTEQKITYDYAVIKE